MKILIDGRLYGLENAGLGRYLINLIDGLSKIDTTNQYTILLRKKYFDKLSLPNNWKKVLADFRHYSFLEQLIIPGIIIKEKPDLTHFPHFNVPIFFRGDFVVTIHDMLMHKSTGFSATTLPAPLYLIKKVAYRLVFDKAVNNAKMILVPSNAVKKEIIAKYKLDGDKIKVTYEGFDKRIKDGAGIEVDKPYFVYIGNAYPHKNLDNLIKAFKLLNTKSDRKIILAISSVRNIFTQRIKNTIKINKVASFVRLLGFVPDEKLGRLLSGSIGFVFPSFSEGFGLPGLEALSSGTLLLASDIPVFREIYQEQAIYFDPDSPESIAESLKNALNIDKNTRLRRVSEGIEFVKIYSWDKMAQETLKIYEESCDSIRSG